jgi:alkylhydroperoxidase family enzyme
MLDLTGWAKSADHAAMDEELEAQAEAALDVIRAAVVRLVRDGGVSPPLVALVVARVAGELGAGIAVADGLGLERVLGELADFVGRAGREQHGLARRERTPADAA